MEKVSILLRNPGEYDKAVHSGLAEGGDMLLITKDGVTNEGNPGIVITFTVQLPDGTLHRAQSSTTLKAFLTAAQVIAAAYAGPLPLPLTGDA